MPNGRTLSALMTPLMGEGQVHESLNIQPQWPEMGYSNKTLKLPYPIFITSLPKTATTSTHVYFQCGGIRSLHHQSLQQEQCRKRQAKQRNKTGTISLQCHRWLSDCIAFNIRNNLPMLHECGKVDVFSDSGFEDLNTCYHPSLSALETFYQSYPRGTILHFYRDPKKWIRSMKTWNKGYMLRAWRVCKSQDGYFPLGENATDEDFIDLYEKHTQRVRQFATEHPSITFAEFETEDPDLADRMEEVIGLQKSCWNVNNCHRDCGKYKRSFMEQVK